MRTRSKVALVLGVILIIGALLSACTTPTPETIEKIVTQEVVKTQEVVTTVEVVKEVTPTPEPAPARKGGWLDEVVFSVVAKDSAVTQLQAGALDIYASGLSSNDLPAIQEANLKYSNQNGLFYELTYNPVGPEFPKTKKLNPFSSAKVREATQYLFDRNYINQEIYAGGALAKFFTITTQFPDYADLADVARRLEAKYAYNVDKANEMITAEMEAMGATMVDGKWNYNGEPVTLIELIRTDSDGTRKPLGDYVANQFESIGFTVDRQYKTSSEASPLWVQGDPADGLWHIYTGAWSATIIDRDQGDNFQFYYDPSSAYGFSPLWQAYKPTEEFAKLIQDLAYNKFTNLDERKTAFARALELSMEDSVRVWLIDGKNFAPFNQNVATTYDLAAGIDGAQIWPYTLRFVDADGKTVEGGTMKWGQPDLFVDPWNPVAGSNWAFDNSAIRATNSGGTMADPYTGLLWPLRIEKAEVTVKEGLPVGKTLDWVDLKTAPSIEVPADTMIDWNATDQKWITVGEKYTDTLTANLKSVVTYPADLSETAYWHDGSPVTAADIMMGMIMTYDPAKPESKIYDESRVSNLEAFLAVFKGFRITSTSPLTVEYYTDQYQLDAELNVYTLWPQYGYGEGSWHAIAVANLAEENGELAYSADKADGKEIEWLSMIGGPSIPILTKYLEQAVAESYIPYAPTMSQYITAEEAQARYANMRKFYGEHGHLWIGTGPYVLDKVFLTEKTLTLKHFDMFPDAADRWSNFGEPKLAEVEIDAPGTATIGQEAVFNVLVTANGEPYPQAEIKQVKGLLYDAKGDIVFVADAVAAADGQYTITVPADITSKMEAGSNKLEVAVVPIVVSIPTFQTFEFVTAP